MTCPCDLVRPDWNDRNGSCARGRIVLGWLLVPDAIVEISLVCIECESVARADDAAGWRAYLTCDEPPEVGVYCPDCAERAFVAEQP
jgi:hypothetical protein